MNTLKKNWSFIAIGLVSLLLALLAILTAVRLREERPVAPTAPESKPQALEGSPVPDCRLTFTITLASPSPTLQCNDNCADDKDCPVGLECIPDPFLDVSYCRNPQCSTDTDCVCSETKPTPTPSPSVSPTPTPSPSASATPPAECGNTCTSNTDCPANLICYITTGQTSGACRHPSCQTDTDCVCDIAQAGATPTPSPSVVPAVPVAGTNWPTLFLILGGMALLIIGFALP